MIVEYMDKAQGPTVNFSSQNLHLAQSEPGKIDPMCTPDPCEEATQSDESTQTRSTSGILLTVLDI